MGYTSKQENLLFFLVKAYMFADQSLIIEITIFYEAILMVILQH